MALNRKTTIMSAQDSLLERNSVVGGPEMLADSLAWAVQHDIPFSTAIDMVTNQTNRRKGFFWLPFWGWERALNRTQLQLDEGKPLSTAMESCMSRYLPRFFIQAVRKGEETNNLDVVLPQLSHQMGYLSDIKSSGSGVLVYFFIQFSIIFILFGLLSVYIMPMLLRLAEHWLGCKAPLAIVLMAAISQPVEDVFSSFGLGGYEYFAFRFWTLLTGLIAVPCLLAYFYRGFKPLIPMIPQRYTLLSYIPVISSFVRRLATIEICAGMSAFLRIGQDLPTAARWCRDSTCYPWMARRLGKLIRRVENGEDWLTAWKEMRLGSAAFDWVMQNAMTRNKPEEGFETIANWEKEQLVSSKRLLLRLFEFCLLAVNTTIVVVLIVALFSVLIEAFVKYSAMPYM